MVEKRRVRQALGRGTTCGACQSLTNKIGTISISYSIEFLRADQRRVGQSSFRLVALLQDGPGRGLLVWQHAHGLLLPLRAAKSLWASLSPASCGGCPASDRAHFSGKKRRPPRIARARKESDESRKSSMRWPLPLALSLRSAFHARRNCRPQSGNVPAARFQNPHSLSCCVCIGPHFAGTAIDREAKKIRRRSLLPEKTPAPLLQGCRHTSGRIFIRGKGIL